MSMTTEALPASRRGTLGLLRSAGVALAVWFAAVALLMPVAPLTGAVIAIGSPARLLSSLDPQASRLLAGGAHSLIVTAPDARSVRALYASGAWLVLPAVRGGCTGLWKPLARVGRKAPDTWRMWAVARATNSVSSEPTFHVAARIEKFLTGEG